MAKDALQHYIHHFQPAQEANKPTLLLLHGTGGDENDLLNLGRMLSPGSALLSPRGNVLENGMPRFFRRFAEGVFDIDDLKQRTVELADFLQAASEEYAFDAHQVVAVGFSNGANIAASMLLLRPEALAGAYLSHAMFPFEPETQVDLQHRSIFVAAGRSDMLIPSENTQRLINLFEQQGAEVQAYWNNTGHTIIHEEVREARAWVEKHF
ncbi:hydrolase [Ktedonobacter sp. SOSP1-85]|uniref:alpha/beta hydrolase n=1 Tax=Ktedonobacter sp. SOSP1-85 TaxID=2778367 RepID=UPI0019168560|nr:alpha/beta hydrolase [Ktedonobacter sp. SOSP1-85]GHO74989.1 hydrolase [Ktedonobacter sp. SOSP1-85]